MRRTHSEGIRVIGQSRPAPRGHSRHRQHQEAYSKPPSTSRRLFQPMSRGHSRLASTSKRATPSYAKMVIPDHVLSSTSHSHFRRSRQPRYFGSGGNADTFEP